jgi:hypothetical protein
MALPHRHAPQGRQTPLRRQPAVNAPVPPTHKKQNCSTVTTVTTVIAVVACSTATVACLPTSPLPKGGQQANQTKASKAPRQVKASKTPLATKASKAPHLPFTHSRKENQTKASYRQTHMAATVTGGDPLTAVTAAVLYATRLAAAAAPRITSPHHVPLSLPASRLWVTSLRHVPASCPCITSRTHCAQG